MGTGVIQQSIITISGNNTYMQNIVKKKNMSDKFLINVTQVIDDCNIDLSHIIDKVMRSQI